MLKSKPSNKNRTRPAIRRQPLAVEQLEDRCLLSVDPVLEWNSIMLDALKNDSYLGANSKQMGPTRASRAFAIVQAAVYDAVNSIDHSYQPYLINVPNPRGTSIAAAVAQAAHDTLVSLFPDYQTTLDSDLNADLAKIRDPFGRAWGQFVGASVAANILAVRAGDHADDPMPYQFGTGPGQWQPDPLHPDQHAVGPAWGEVKTFGIPNMESFHVPAPPALDSPAYADAYNEVKNYGGDGIHTPTMRTAEQTQIGIFWGYDGSPGLGTPPRFYNQIAEVLSVQKHLSVVQNARFFALINLALGDAGIACWDGKYDYVLWRPITGIREGDTDSNPNTDPDPNWTYLGAPADNGGGTNFTPPFPSYSSGHATFGGALFRMMADFFGTDSVHFTIGSDEFNGVTKDQFGNKRPIVFRSFNSFSQAAEENGQSRIYLGIHWAFDKTAGIACGESIADYIFNNLLLPRRTSVAANTVTLPTAGTDASGQLGSMLLTPVPGFHPLTPITTSAATKPVPVNSTSVVTTSAIRTPSFALEFAPHVVQHLTDSGSGLETPVKSPLLAD